MIDLTKSPCSLTCDQLTTSYLRDFSTRTLVGYYNFLRTSPGPRSCETRNRVAGEINTRARFNYNYAVLKRADLVRREIAKLEGIFNMDSFA